MKTPILLLSLVLAAPLSAETHSLVKVWETPASLKTPESVLVDPDGGVLYVSNIDGQQPWAKDGKGSIGKLGADGKIIAVDWVSGLHAPKGMGLHKGRLYVADVDRVVVVDVAKAAIVETIAVEGAQQLNDIGVDADGLVYVSDSKVGTVHTLSGGKPALLLQGLKGPNGVLAHGKSFYVLADGSMFKLETDKSLTKLAAGIEGGADGIEHVRGDSFIVSGWNGVIYLVDAKTGEKQLLLDSRPQRLQTADLGYDAKKRIVYVPTFFTNTVVAYELK